jgi:hypothetical protein
MFVDCLNVRAEIEQAAHATNNSRKGLDVWESDVDPKTLLFRQVSHRNASYHAVDLHRPQVTRTLHHFDTRNRTRTQEAEHVFPVIRRPITKSKDDAFLLFLRSAFSPQGPGGALEEMEKCLIEPPQATESGCGCDLSHRHPGIVDQLFCKQHSPCLCDRDRGCTKMLEEEPTQLTFAHA